VKSLSPWVQDPFAAVPVADVERQAIFYTPLGGPLERRDLASAAVIQTSAPEPPLSRYGVAISGDGRLLATPVKNFDSPDSADHLVDILDAHTLDVRRRLGPLDFPTWWVWLNGDGSLLVAASDSPGHHIELWETQTGRRRWITDIGHALVTTIALAPDGHTLVAGTQRGEVVTLDVATGKVLARLAQQITARLISAEFSPDGEIIAVSGGDSQVHLLEAATLRQIGALPMPTGAQWTFVSFYPDGARMSAVDERGRIVQWETGVEAWIDRACAIVGRDFTPTEWETYLPGVEYEPTCTDLR
jgi:hypothetical protein